MRLRAGRLRARTGRLGRARRASLLLSWEWELVSLSPAVQVREPSVVSLLLSAEFALALPAYLLNPPRSRSTFFSHLHRPQANIISRRLRLAHSLDLKLSLRLRPLQLANSNHRRARSLRRLGSRLKLL
jgi:hypothetical protein